MVNGAPKSLSDLWYAFGTQKVCKGAVNLFTDPCSPGRWVGMRCRNVLLEKNAPRHLAVTERLQRSRPSALQPVPCNQDDAQIVSMFLKYSKIARQAACSTFAADRVLSIFSNIEAAEEIS